MRTLALAFVAVCAIASTFASGREPLLVWNASASAPIGFYAVHPAGALAVTDLIVARPPELLAEWLAARGYLPKGALLLKRVAALPGQKVCRTDFTISVTAASSQRRTRAIARAAICRAGVDVSRSDTAKSSCSIGTTPPLSTPAILARFRLTLSSVAPSRSGRTRSDG